MVTGSNSSNIGINEIPTMTTTNESMYLPITIYQSPVNCLVDSGSTLTLIHPAQFALIPKAVRPDLQDKKIKLRMADGGVIESKGEALVQIKIGNLTFPHLVTIAEVEAPLVIGYDFLTQYGCLLDFKTGSFQVNGRKFPCVRLDHTEKILHVTVTETVTLPPLSESVFLGTIVTSKQRPLEFDCGMVNQIPSLPNMESLILAKTMVDPNHTQIPLRLVKGS